VRFSFRLKRAIRLSRELTVSLILILSLGAGLVLAKDVDAAFVNPTPIVINLEDFQNVTSGSTYKLESYVGADGNTYTADPYWLNENYCNGIITQYGVSNIACVNSNSVGDYADRNIQRMAHVLGQVHGMADPTQNFAVSAWTTAPNFDVDPPYNAVEFQSVNPYSINVAGRFVNISVDVAEASCGYLGGVNNSRLMFYVVDAGVEQPLTDNPIVPCTDSRASNYDAPLLPGGPWGDGGIGVSAGRFFGDRSYLFSGATLGVIMRNQTDNHLGNDHAWDNIYFLDTSPTLHKTFSEPVLDSRQTRVTFSVVNTSELSSKQGWSFTDMLSGGLNVAEDPEIQTTCANAVVNAVGNSINLSGDLNNGQEFCELSLNLVGEEFKVPYENCPANFTQSQGLNLPECTSVVFSTSEVVTEQLPQPLASTGANQVSLVISSVILMVLGAVILRNRSSLS
jgi:hypothetical protein